MKDFLTEGREHRGHARFGRHPHGRPGRGSDGPGGGCRHGDEHRDQHRDERGEQHGDQQRSGQRRGYRQHHESQRSDQQADEQRRRDERPDRQRGAWRHRETAREALRDLGGALIAVVHSGDDDKRVEAEKVLAEASARLRSLASKG